MVKIVFAGSPQVAVPAFERLLSLPAHEVVGVLTRPPARAGRGRKEKPSQIDQVASQTQIPVLRPQTLKDPAVLNQLSAWGPDLGVVVAYGRLIPAPVLEIPTHGWINIHFSALPRWRGAAPVQRAIQNGDEELAVSIFRLETGLDTGPLYYQHSWPLQAGQTAGQALEFLSNAALDGLEKTLQLIEQGATPTPQSANGVTIAAQIKPEEAQIPWHQNASVVRRHIQAFTPNPGAWTLWRGTRCKIGAPDEGMSREDLPALRPGQIWATKKEVWVGTGSEPIKLSEVAPAGKKNLAAPDWARGAQLDPASRFEEAL